jgi:hypothetical protein
MPRSTGAVPEMLAPYVATEAWAPVTAGSAEAANSAVGVAEEEVAAAAPAQLPFDESPGTPFGFEPDTGGNRIEPRPAAAGAEASPEPFPPTSSDQAWLEALDWLPASAEAPPKHAPAEPVRVETSAQDPEPGRAASEPVAAEASEDLPPWMAWIEDEQTEAPGVDLPLVAVEELLADPGHDVEELPRDPVIQELVEQVVGDSEQAALAGRVAEATSKLGAAEAGGMPAGFAGVFHEVADRLENIAGSLRRRSSGEAGAATGETDPLELLLTGFVLGYVARQGREPTPPGKER